MLKRIFHLVFIAMLLGLWGCSNDMDRLDKVCEELEAASLMTDDCERMAKALKPTTEEFMAIVDRLSTTVPSEAERAQYVDKVSTCMRLYLEIETGSCGSHEAIQPILANK